MQQTSVVAIWRLRTEAALCNSLAKNTDDEGQGLRCIPPRCPFMP